MTQATEARRWKLVALASMALLVGYIAGQLSPAAVAQQSVTKVQLDTSNCVFGETRSLELPAGVVPIVFRSQGAVMYYVTCD